MKTLRERVFDLCTLHGPSSREDDVIAYMREAFSQAGGEVSVDRLGNVTCYFACGQPDAKRLLVFAHTDEIGMIVRKVDPNGFIGLQRVGGVHVNVLAGIRMDILGDHGVVQGVLGVKSHHVTPISEKGVIPDVEKLYLDIGARSAEEALEMGVHTGCFVTYAAEKPLTLGENLISAKAIDNRACCAALIEYARCVYGLQREDSLHWDVYIVACVQEEFNVRGIMPAVTHIRPDASIGLDICIAGDTPDLRDYNEIVLGGGPAITYMNFHGRGTLAGVLPDKKLQQALVQTCVAEGIPFQREVIVGVITENAFISFSGEGVSVANISLPCRYSHTPIETADERDLGQMVELLAGFTRSLEQGTQFGHS